MSANTLPNDNQTRPASGGFDAVNTQVVAFKILNAIFANGYWSGDIGVVIDQALPSGTNDVGTMHSVRTAIAVYTLTSTTTTGTTQNSGDIAVGPYSELSIDITTTAQTGTSPTVQYIYERKGADNLYYPLWTSQTFASATNTISTSIGAGMPYNQSLGLTGRLRWVVGGTATPTWTHSINCYAK